MDDNSTLNREYSPSYFNYHRNALVIFGLCSAIWLFNVKLDLENLAWISEPSPALNSLVPWMMWVSAIYCFILFWAEWRIQSVSHFSTIGDDLKALGDQLGGIETAAREYSANLASLKEDITRIRAITDDPSQILLKNQREIYSKYSDHFSRKICDALPISESLINQISIIDSEIDSIYNDRNDIEEFRKKFLLQQLAYANNTYHALESCLAGISADTAGFGEMIESPFHNQSSEFRQLSESITILSKKIENIYVQNESFSNVISYFKNRSKSVKFLISIKVYFGGIGSILLMFLVSLFSIIYHNFLKY